MIHKSLKQILERPFHLGSELAYRMLVLLSTTQVFVLNYYKPLILTLEFKK